MQRKQLQLQLRSQFQYQSQCGVHVSESNNKPIKLCDLLCGQVKWYCGGRIEIDREMEIFYDLSPDILDGA